MSDVPASCATTDAIIGCLEDLLKKARAGEIRDFAFAISADDADVIHHGWHGHWGRMAGPIGSLFADFFGPDHKPDGSE
jgi:hypothetical protein